MSRPARFYSNVNALGASDALLWLGRMWGGGMSEPVRMVRDTPGNDLTYGGEVYTATWFGFDIKAEEGRPVQFTWRVPNVSRDVGRLLEAIPGRPRIWLGAVYRADPSQLVWQQTMLRAASFAITEAEIEVEIATIDTGTEPVNGGVRAVQSILPGMAYMQED